MITRPPRIGLFPYLNVQPLVYGLGTEADCEIVIDVPSRIADRFRTGELDVAMVPAFEAASMHSPILDSICIASDGAVESVKLHHRVALDRVRTLAIDEASRTSGALAKILVAQATGRMPQCSSFSPRSNDSPDHDAFVVIGDPAFARAEKGFETLDLGAEWRRQHDLPFVFAVMVAGPGTPTGFSQRILEATRRGLEEVPSIARSYNSGLDAARAEHYLRSVIRFELGPREKEGLALFYRLAHANGLIAELKELQFHAI